MTNLAALSIVTYRTVEMHTGGEPVRLVLEGFPEPSGASVPEKRHDAAARLDLHRRRLMLEPRGHAEMYGALVVPAAPPASPCASRHFYMFGEGQIDRSATGSGVTARMAVDAARGLISPGATRAFAGASGVPFHAELLDAEQLGPHRAWRVRVAGTAAFSGTATWIVDDADALRDGFSIEDQSPLSSL
jgi:proline racemase